MPSSARGAILRTSSGWGSCHACSDCPNVEHIICPVLAAGVKTGTLSLDKKGQFDADALKAFLESIHVGPFFAAVGATPFPVEVYEMDGKIAFEHGKSSGIRDPRLNRTRLDILLSYADEAGERATRGMHGAILHLHLPACALAGAQASWARLSSLLLASGLTTTSFLRITRPT